MKKIVLYLTLLLAPTFLAVAQNCKFYYPDTKGARLEYTSFNAKDKVTGSSIQQVKEIEENGNTLLATIEVQTFDKKGEEIGTKEYQVKCENGVYSVDMKSYMDPATLAAYEDMEVKVSNDNLKTPTDLKVGDQLEDGALDISVFSEGIKIMGMSTDITKRKVEGKEQITTEAGTFDCYKISYTITVKTMFSVRMEAAEWITEGIGTVKSETYSRGEMVGYTLLTAYEK